MLPVPRSSLLDTDTRRSTSMASRSRLFAACLQGLACLSLSTALFLPRIARAEKVIAKSDNWEVYTDGRVGAFLTWTVGDAQPVTNGEMITLPDGTVQPKSINGGGWLATPKEGGDTTQGTVNTMR